MDDDLDSSTFSDDSGDDNSDGDGVVVGDDIHSVRYAQPTPTSREVEECAGMVDDADAGCGGTMMADAPAPPSATSSTVVPVSPPVVVIVPSVLPTSPKALSTPPASTMGSASFTTVSTPPAPSAVVPHPPSPVASFRTTGVTASRPPLPLPAELSFFGGHAVAEGLWAMQYSETQILFAMKRCSTLESAVILLLSPDAIAVMEKEAVGR
jgi:hypothetical protein